MTEQKKNNFPALTDYIEAGRIVTGLFTLAGIVLAGQVFSAWASAGEQTEFTNAILSGQGAASWFASVLFGLSAMASWRMTDVAAKKTHGRTWAAMTFLFLLFSAAEVHALPDMLGWASLITISAPASLMMLSILVLLPFLWAGVRLRDALQDSFESAGNLLLGAILYLGSSLTLATLYLNGGEERFAALQAILYSALRMLGAVLLFAGLLSHERMLSNQRERLKSGYTPTGIPAARSKRAAWVLRMIGTPTRDEVLMEDEVRRAKARAKAARLQGK